MPKLQRSELETACEDFSNVIGSLSDGMVYKGTLSSGVEIAVKSIAVKSAADWSKSLEAQFRKKVNHIAYFTKTLDRQLLIISVHFSDRHTIKNEPQELCEPYRVL